MLHASYAKINLFLEVLAKLPDNYHSIETLLCSVSVFDTLRFALTKRPDIKLWSNLPEMAVDNNLIYQVARFMKDRFMPLQGVEISLDKHIPIAAGLGGGSSNAAITILALNSLWDLRLGMPEMEEIASRFGSDISFFLYGGSAWASHRGEVVEPCEDICLDNILLVNPRIAIPSSQAYKLVELPDSSRLHCFNSVDWKYSCFNRLESGIRKAYPEVDNIIGMLHEFGAKPAMMSGSGSTCFGIFEQEYDIIRSQQYFDKAGYWTKKVRTLTRKETSDVFKT